MMPALLTRMSRRPNRVNVASNNFATSAALLTSACTATAWPPTFSLHRTAVLLQQWVLNWRLLPLGLLDLDLALPARLTTLTC
jgi:hypothetical protein